MYFPPLLSKNGFLSLLMLWSKLCHETSSLGDGGGPPRGTGCHWMWRTCLVPVHCLSTATGHKSSPFMNVCHLTVFLGHSQQNLQRTLPQYLPIVFNTCHLLVVGKSRETCALTQAYEAIVLEERYFDTY